MIQMALPSVIQLGKPLRRKGHLVGNGVFEELHMDGHEKINWKALGLGKVGIDIYGMKDHCSGLVVAEYAVPNARCEDTVAHCYLDMILEYGGKSCMSEFYVIM